MSITIYSKNTDQEEPKRFCKHCLKEFPERLIQEHHIHPKFMDNPKGDGMKISLCEKCHNIIHLKIAAIIWKFIPEDKKEDCLDSVIKFTRRYGKL